MAGGHDELAGRQTGQRLTRRRSHRGPSRWNPSPRARQCSRASCWRLPSRLSGIGTRQGARNTHAIHRRVLPSALARLSFAASSMGEHCRGFGSCAALKACARRVPGPTPLWRPISTLTPALLSYRSSAAADRRSHAKTPHCAAANAVSWWRKGRIQHRHVFPGKISAVASRPRQRVKPRVQGVNDLATRKP